MSRQEIFVLQGQFLILCGEEQEETSCRSRFREGQLSAANGWTMMGSNVHQNARHDRETRHTKNPDLKSVMVVEV